MVRNQVHELNRDHIAAEIACLLAGWRNELWRRFREEFSGWRPMPLYAAVVGSAARGDGDDASDIDRLLVHPPFPGEKRPTRVSANLRAELADSLGQALSVTDDTNGGPALCTETDCQSSETARGSAEPNVGTTPAIRRAQSSSIAVGGAFWPVAHHSHSNYDPGGV